MPYLDPNIARKNSFQNAHLSETGTLPNGSPTFSEVEFNTSGLCNRTCVFCPRVDPKVFPNVNEHLPLDLYKKILVDLAEINYSGRITHSGFSEPLLHPKINDILRATRDILPESVVEIITNGDKLTAGIIKDLFEAGLTTLLISMYDGPEQTEFFERMTREAGLPQERVILRERYLPPEQGYGINLTNRAGMVSVNEAGVSVLLAPMKHSCYYTHYRMMIDYTGEVLLCPHDWGKRLIVGNLHNERIQDVWTGQALSAVRQRLGKGDRAFPPCDKCDVLGTRQGGEHFKAWERFYNHTTVSS